MRVGSRERTGTKARATDLCRSANFFGRRHDDLEFLVTNGDQEGLPLRFCAHLPALVQRLGERGQGLIGRVRLPADGQSLAPVPQRLRVKQLHHVEAAVLPSLQAGHDRPPLRQSVNARGEQRPRQAKTWQEHDEPPAVPIRPGEGQISQLGRHPGSRVAEISDPVRRSFQDADVRNLNAPQGSQLFKLVRRDFPAGTVQHGPAGEPVALAPRGGAVLPRHLVAVVVKAHRPDVPGLRATGATRLHHRNGGKPNRQLERGHLQNCRGRHPDQVDLSGPFQGRTNFFDGLENLLLQASGPIDRNERVEGGRAGRCERNRGHG